MEYDEVLTVEDLQKRLKVGRDKAYAIMTSPAFPSTKLGRTYFVTTDKLKDWLDMYAGREFKL